MANLCSICVHRGKDYMGPEWDDEGASMCDHPVVSKVYYAVFNVLREEIGGDYPRPRSTYLVASENDTVFSCDFFKDRNHPEAACIFCKGTGSFTRSGHDKPSPCPVCQPSPMRDKETGE